jgi:anti-sigma factor RsiW
MAMTDYRNHGGFCELLPLMAAGCLDPAEEKQLAHHLQTCAACATELERLHAIATGLRRLPTPQPSPSLFERTRAAVEVRFVQQAEDRWNRSVMIFLIAFAWVVTVLSWPIFRVVTGGLLSMLDVRFAQAWLSFGIFTGLVWLAGAAAAILLSLHQRRERRMA